MARYLLLLICLVACHAQPERQVKTATTGAIGLSWGIGIADKLYARQVLSAAGRDELHRLMRANELNVYYNLPADETSYPHQAIDPATVLTFCAQAFQSELYYRAGLDDVSRTSRPAQQSKLKAALNHGQPDTAALRQLLSPGQLLETKIRAEDSVSRGGWTIYPPLGANPAHPPYVAATRSVFGKTRTRTAQDLLQLGLLTAAQHRLLAAELAAGQLTTEEQVCQRAATLALDVAVYPVRRVAFEKLLTKLHQTGLVSAAKQQRALADTQLTKTFALFDVLPYCAHAQILNLHKLPQDPQHLYPQLLTAVTYSWPAFQPTQVQAHLTEHDTGAGAVLEQQVELAFMASGRHYATKFTQGYRRKDGQQTSPAAGAEIGENFQAGINQWLRDQGLPERLYLATTPDAQSVYGRDRVGLAMMTPAQRDAWGSSMYFLSLEAQASEFTSSYVEEALALYQRIGLFKGLTESELVAGRHQALSGEATSYIELLRCFPHLLADTGGEDAEEPQAYAKALAQVAAITRGAFRPTHVHDSFMGEQSRKQQSALTFSCGGRQYQATFTSDLGWMDDDFVDLVRRAVRENTAGGQLYYIGGDEASSFLFLTAAQASVLRKAQPTLFQADDEDKAKK